MLDKPAVTMLFGASRGSPHGIDHLIRLRIVPRILKFPVDLVDS